MSRNQSKVRPFPLSRKQIWHGYWRSQRWCSWWTAGRLNLFSSSVKSWYLVVFVRFIFTFCSLNWLRCLSGFMFASLRIQFESVFLEKGFWRCSKDSQCRWNSLELRKWTSRWNLCCLPLYRPGSRNHSDETTWNLKKNPYGALQWLSPSRLHRLFARLRFCL